MKETAEFIFWVSLTLLTYSYAGYPILLLCICRSTGIRASESEPVEPSVSIVMPVFNEENVIAEKINNLLSLRYPNEKFEILIVSDASSDKTAEIVKSFRNEGVRLLELEKRTGKAGALNLGLADADGEVVVFTDASILLEPDALAEIVKPFQDPRIGCVSGEDHIDGGSGEGFYGRYELFLRNMESRAGSIVGASGCFYAQRRDLASGFKPGTAPDFHSVLETVEKGYRAITCRKARGYMGSVKSAKGEFRRKIRTLLRGITTLMVWKHLLNPGRYGLFAISLWSHKVLRWFGGVLLLNILCANIALAANPIYMAALILQIGFYLSAVFGLNGKWKLANRIYVRIPFFFCYANIATMVAVARFVKGDRQEIWEPTRR